MQKKTTLSKGLNKVAKKRLKTIRRHTFAGNNYLIKFKKPEDWDCGEGKKVPVNGLCDEPKAEAKGIIIDPGIDEIDFLKTCIDEGIHACNWTLDNDAVGHMSEALGSFLWRIGFRVNPQPPR